MILRGTASPTRYVKALAKDADFKETDHPRRDDGKFGSGGGASNNATPASAEAVEKFAQSPITYTSRASGIEYVQNQIPVIPASERSSSRTQADAMEDAMVSKDADKYFSMEEVDPSKLKSLQNIVSRDQVLDVAKKGLFNSEELGEAPLVIKSPDGLVLIDGNHRANAAILAKKPLKAQVFDYDAWEKRDSGKPEEKSKWGPDDDALLAELTA